MKITYYLLLVFTIFLISCTRTRQTVRPAYGLATTENPLLLVRIDENQVPSPQWLDKSRLYFADKGLKSISYISMADTLYANLIQVGKLDEVSLKKMGEITKTDYFVHGYFGSKSENQGLGWNRVEANRRLSVPGSDRWVTFHLKAYDLHSGKEVASVTTKVQSNAMSKERDDGDESRYYVPINLNEKAFRKTHKKFYNPK
ncbi:MAG: hypothetical protein ACJAWV_001524 [Flammeovirgaceae bacterium]|jgi:hypothetical protein